MIGISTITQNAAGDLVIYEKPQSDLQTVEARASRTATLDLGVVVDVQGFTDGDRTLRVNASLNVADAEKLWDITRNGNLINVSLPDGFYRAIITRLNLNGGEVDFTVMIAERLSQ